MRYPKLEPQFKKSSKFQVQSLKYKSVFPETRNLYFKIINLKPET